MKKLIIILILCMSINNIAFAESRTLNTALQEDIHTQIKIGSTGNLVTIDGAGIVLTGTKMVIRRQEVDLTKMKLGVGNPPAEGLEDGFQTLDFSPTTDEETFASFGSPSAWAATADGVFYFSFFVDTAPASAQNVVWGIEYVSIAADGSFDFTGTTTLTDTVAITTGTPANDSKIHTGSITIPVADLIGGGILLVRFFRDADNGSDTFTGDARFFRLYIEFLSDKMGEEQ